ncbi:aminotransferase class I/II-fold pyridoxal phosphate-dependent enzyme [Paenibacillus sp. LMG 31461]|uniref:Aminotransferase class I/II-fold pyridoxal phosphate-dependent enzyme n=1 Tax=Paenibacillus plantarum TaxID=2654975 RepID=A0ABX1X550_9BACL|nr:PLP-dependent aminotransferase family protein [Paenibacillus plantarum]NOU63140.1 aminotransferase class I/II-fold pyridoxal phosphate-dependent enzyme [Paenibacillus plantarum]
MAFYLPFHTYCTQYPSKYAALYHALRDEIIGNKLKQHTKLPSSRDLADQLGISRGTVNQVYDMLIAEGYLQADVGRGTFVVYADGHVMYEPKVGKNIELSAWAVRVSQGVDAGGQQVEGVTDGIKEQGDVREGKADGIKEQGKVREGKSDGGKEKRKERELVGKPAGREIAFVVARPQMEQFPREQWNRGMYEQVRRMTESPQEDAHIAEGHYALREAIAVHLRRMRGIDALPERIVIVNGSMQAIALLTQLLVNPGDPVVLERPGYQGASRAVLAAGGVPVHAPVDEQGLIPQPWNARVLFVTPSRQFPTGAVLGMERRQLLLRWAAEQGAVIVEDDYDSEFRHRGRPIEPLKVLDQEGRVVYIGTFSKTMLQDLRIGYVVLPEALHDAFIAAKRLYEPHPTGLLEQRSLAAFMASGGYERHLRRMRRVYASKFLLLQALLQEQLSTLFEWVDSDSGLHLFGWWRGDLRTYTAYAAACRAAGVTWTDAGNYALPVGRAGVCFGFAHLTEAEIKQGITLLRSISIGFT